MKSRLRLINFILMFVMCFAALGFSPKPVSSQVRAVSTGDIALILVNMDDADGLAFVALADLAEGEVIRFTDSGWYGAGGFRATEGAITYTVPTGGISAGTIVSRDGPFNTEPWAVDSSDLGTSGLSLSTGGDQIIVLQGTAASPSFIYALNDDGSAVWQADATSSNTSALPTGLTNGTDAIALNEVDNAKLNCTGNLSGTKEELLAYISNASNWVGDDVTRQSVDGSCSFTVTGPVSDPKINEFSVSTTGTDVEYFEIIGDPNTDYSDYTGLYIEGDYNVSDQEGVIDYVITIGTTDANGLYVANIAANSMENQTYTLLLVKGFSNPITNDLDTDDDGALDVTPWESIVDSVAVNDGGVDDLTYAEPVLGVAYDGLDWSPGGASRIPDGFDTESATDWVRNDFDLAGVPTYTGTIGPFEAFNTPGELNEAYTILINEVDSDTVGTDTAEFLELYDGVGNTALDGLVVVFYNGNGDVSYQAFDLDTYTTDADGYFVLCGNAANVANCDLDVTPDSDLIQNGADAIALYMGDATSFPTGSAVTTVNLVDALVYDTADSDDAGLLVLLNAGQAQIDEAGGGDKDNESNQRCPNGTGGLRNTDTYTQDSPSPGAENCVAPVEAAPEVSSTVPADSAIDVAVDANIAITFSEPVTVTGTWFTISCTSSGTHTAAVTDSDPIFTLDPDTDFDFSETCTVTVVAANVNDDDTDDDVYDTMVSDYVFSFDTGEAPEVCGDPFTPIYDIQGSGAATPLDTNTEISTEGVVVGDFQTSTYVSGSKNGFYIQAITGDGNPLTSDGIFVYYYAGDVQVGEHVRVTGKPAEYTTGSGTLTQITSITNILTCSSGNSITPTTLSLPVAADFNYETLEGMLVTYPQALIISEYFNYDRYGEILLTSTRHMTFTAEFEPDITDYTEAVAEFTLDKITLDDGRTAQNPDPALHPNGATFDLTNRFRGGDTLTNVTGILDWYQSLYRIQPTQGADYLAANPRPTELTVAEGDLTVASFNVLNYFLTIDDGVNDICSPSGTLECRGADTAEELTRQRAKILAALSDIEADVFGLMEIENDSPLGAGDAVADLVSGLNDIFGADTYDYIDTGAIGTDAIKQAIIYKPSAVTPVGTYEILDSTYDIAFIDDANRPTLAQSFTDNLTGKSFTVAVNHLKSKGSACSGDPDLGDGAGNCNLTRKAAAEVMVDWLADETVFPGVTNYLIIGDLNSYDKEDPIDAIKLGADDLASTDDDFVDMIDFFQGEYAYGYVYDGQVGYLDYALANNNLAAWINDVNIWHINADEPDLLDYDMSFKLPAQDLLYEPNAYRSSDHDPVIVRISFNNTPVALDDAFETPEDTLLEVAAPGVLDNDTDNDGEDTLTAELVTDVTAGTLVLNSDGSFSFTPAQDATGEFTFTYRAFDGSDYSDTVTVTITVTPVNDSPVAEDDYYETGWNVVLNVPAPGVLSNDSDPDSGDLMEVVLMTPTQHGIVTLYANGSFTYIPDPGFSGEDSFIYALVSLPGGVRVGGYADTATVYITVHPPFTYFLPWINNN